MRKLFWIILGVLGTIVLFCSCELFGEKEEIISSTSYWKLKSSEFWGVKPAYGAKYEQFASFPFNQTYNFNSRTNVTYSGQEGNITRTEKDPLSNLTLSLNTTWSSPPSIINPNTPYKVNYEAKGTVGNGIGVSRPVYYNGVWQWNPISTRNGALTANLIMSMPDADPNHRKMKIGVNISSESSYYMEWVYVYEWIP